MQSVVVHQRRLTHSKACVRFLSRFGLRFFLVCFSNLLFVGLSQIFMKRSIFMKSAKQQINNNNNNKVFKDLCLSYSVVKLYKTTDEYYWKIDKSPISELYLATFRNRTVTQGNGNNCISHCHNFVFNRELMWKDGYTVVGQLMHKWRSFYTSVSEYIKGVGEERMFYFAYVLWM